jgi:hypothetical protein
MGYYISLHEQEFRIEASKKEAALAALKEHTKATEHGYSWVSRSDVLNSNTIEESLSLFGWDPRVNYVGDIVSLDYYHSKIGSEETLFGLLAPFVVKGSYLQIQGEEGDLWRWFFDGYELAEIIPIITWNM